MTRAGTNIDTSFYSYVVARESERVEKNGHVWIKWDIIAGFVDLKEAMEYYAYRQNADMKTLFCMYDSKRELILPSQPGEIKIGQNGIERITNND